MNLLKPCFALTGCMSASELPQTTTNEVNSMEICPRIFEIFPLKIKNVSIIVEKSQFITETSFGSIFQEP